jgi:hypothetical protein
VLAFNWWELLLLAYSKLVPVEQHGISVLSISLLLVYRSSLEDTPKTHQRWKQYCVLASSSISVWKKIYKPHLLLLQPIFLFSTKSKPAFKRPRGGIWCRLKSCTIWEMRLRRFILPAWCRLLASSMARGPIYQVMLQHSPTHAVLFGGPRKPDPGGKSCYNIGVSTFINALPEQFCRVKRKT